MSNIVQSNLVKHAEYELRRAGMFDADADYDGALAPAVLALIEVFAEQRHSGMSAAITRELFHKLSGYEPLTPITSDAEEWIDQSEASGRPMWQNRRDPKVFSHDAGQSWYRLGEEPDAH